MTIMGAQDDEFPMNWGRIPSLFTQRRRRGILRRSDAGSCLERPPRGERMPSEAIYAAWEGLHVVVVHKDRGRE
jgi:hypothetical protein